MSVVNAFAYGISFASTLVLARLLSPTQFGQAALAITIAEFLFVAASWSLPVALVREPAESATRAFDTAIILMIAVGAGVLTLAGGLAVVLWVVASGLLAAIFVAIVAGRVLSILGLCFAADLERRFAYKSLAIVQSGSFVASVAVAVPLGALGFGVWALAFRDIVVSVATFALAVTLSRWWPKWSFDLEKAKELMSFGTRMIGSRLGDLLFHRYDNLIVGTMSGTHTLGLYNQAYVLAETVYKIYAPITYQIPLATYSRLQREPGRQERAFRFTNFILVRSVVPIAVLFVVLPKELLGFILGSNWRPASDMLRGLSVYAVLLPLYDHMRILLIARGALGQVLRARMVQLAFFLPVTPVLVAGFGGEGAAVAVAVAIIIGTASIAIYCTAHLDLTVRYAVRDAMPPVMAGVGAALVAYLASVSLSGDGTRVAAGTGSLVASYVLILLTLERVALVRNFCLAWAAIRPARSSDRHAK